MNRMGWGGTPRLMGLLAALAVLISCGVPSDTPRAVRAEIPEPTAVSPEPETVSPIPETGTPEPVWETVPADGGEVEETPPQWSRAAEVLAEMTTHEKICQLFIVFPADLTGQTPVTVAREATSQALERYPVGGLIYDRSSMVTQEQIRTMLDNTRSYSRVTPFLTCDEEGGRVNRLMGAVGTPYVGPMLRYKEQGTEKARENAETIAGGLVSCGFNMDLAPVADVWSNRSNTVIGDRAYSDDYEEAAELVSAAVEGFHAGGVACVLKHFPGHGDTDEDSHYGTAYVRKGLDELRDGEFLPFAAGIQAGADAVMIGHLTASELDSEPAPFSYRIVTELLREELGFDGVVMTDSLQMEAVSDHYGSGEAALKALGAGVDMLLCPADLAEAVETLEHAAQMGTLSEERLNESVLRILILKEARGLL